jgi:hypothetical protein
MGGPRATERGRGVRRGGGPEPDLCADVKKTTSFFTNCLGWSPARPVHPCRSASPRPIAIFLGSFAPSWRLGHRAYRMSPKRVAQPYETCTLEPTSALSTTEQLEGQRPMRVAALGSS